MNNLSKTKKIIRYLSGMGEMLNMTLAYFVVAVCYIVFYIPFIIICLLRQDWMLVKLGEWVSDSPERHKENNPNETNR